MTKRAFLFVLSLFLLTLPVLSDELPQVLQPNTTAYSATEVATLTQAITTLEKTLYDYNLGSRRYFASDQWSSRDFAAYTAGSLAEMGYEAVLVSGAGWPEGTHTWVLVGVPRGERTAWIPVEASPEAGSRQETLGLIPSSADEAGNLWFDQRYLGFSKAFALPANTPPIATFYLRETSAPIGESVKFLARGSYDPDGEIVLYQWDFGDGRIVSSPSWSVLHRFSKQATLTVRLTVIDNLGKSSSTENPFSVIRVDEAGEEVQTGCGCGK